MTRAVLVGIGSYLPDNIVTNKDLEARMETSDAWIRERTGIAQRHIAAEGQTTSDLATKAAQRALADAKLQPQDIDAIIIATGTPDFSMPSTATIVQKNIGNHGAMAMDIAAACSGFVYGMTLSKSLIESGQCKRILLIGAETMSRIVDWDDRGTCILFGDGAGAVILEAQENTPRGIIACAIEADGQYNNILQTNGGVSTNQKAGVLTMSGKEVFRHGVEKMATATQDLLAKQGMTLDDIDWIVPHQANARIVQSIAKKVDVPLAKCIMTLDNHANTSAASIPLALDVAVKDGRIKAGNMIAMPALGAGLTWGCCIIHW